MLTLDHVLKSAVNSTGGVGLSILFRATDNISQLSNLANISAILYNATNGSQLSALTFSTREADIGDESFGHLLERLRIDGYGRVGINDTTPSGALDVDTSSADTLVVTSGKVGIGTAAPTVQLEVRGGVNISGGLNVTSGNVLLAVTAGNVGIGTSTPNTKLEVNGTSTFGGNVNIPSNNLNVGGGYSSGGITLVGTGTDKGSGQFGRNILLDGDIISVFDVEINQSFVPKLDLFSLLGNVSQRFLDIFAANIKAGNRTLNITGNVSVGEDTLFVDNTSRRVGIGTSAPNEALVVIGNMRVTGAINVTSINASEINVTSLILGWTNLTTYPSACSAGQFVTQVGDTLTCSTPTPSSGGGWTDDGSVVRLTSGGDLVGIGTAKADNRLTITGTDTDSYLDDPGILHLNITDSQNTSLTNIITLDHLLNNPLNATNPKAGVRGGIGLGILFRAINNISEIINVSFINATLVDARNGSEAGALTFYTANISGIETRLVPRLILNGSDVFIAPAGQGNSYINPNGGSVGIGTTSPQNLLDVAGAATFAKGVNASNLNVTGFSIADDSLVTIVEFDEKENKEEKSGFHSLANAPRPDLLSPRTEDIKQNLYKYLSGSNSLSSEMNFPPPASISIKKLKIKDIKAGQYVLSLNEATGKLEPAKVNALLDHGIKPIYEMATEDGRAINTTAEHPYFVKYDTLPNKISRASEGVITPSGKDSFNPLSPERILQPNLRDRATYGTSFKCGAIDTADFALSSNALKGIISTDLLMNSSTSKISSLGSFDREAILSRLLSSSEYIYCVDINSNLSNIMKIRDFQDTENLRFSRVSFNSKIKRDLPIVTNAENTTLKSTTKSIVYGPFTASPFEYFIPAEARNLFDIDKLTSSANSFACFSVNSDLETIDSIFFISDNFFLSSSFKNLENNSCNIPSGTFFPNIASNSFLTSSGTLNNNSAILASPKINNENSYLKLSNDAPLGEWIEVRYLKIGDEIAVPDYETNTIKFEKIASIKTLEPQHVYDLSIDGTRNFIANDIVAHNTYLATSSGKVGIGTTAPATVLDVKGKANFTGNFSIMNTSDTIFFVDNTSGRVGIGTTSPAVKLVVIGNVNISDSLNVTKTVQATTFIGDGSQLTGISSATPPWNSSGLNVYLNDSTAKVGIGTTAPNAKLVVIGGANISGGLNVTAGDVLLATASGNVGIGTTAPAHTLTVQGRVNISQNLTVNNSVLFVDGTAGRVGFGTAAPGFRLHIVEDGASGILMFERGGTDTDPINPLFRKSRGTTPSPTIILDGDRIMDLQAQGYDGATYRNSAQILFVVDGAPGDGDMPGRIVFLTSLDGTTTLVERMRITNAGNVGIGTTAPNAKLVVIGGANISGGLNVSAGNVLLATESGNVGIGTTAPNAKLVVIGGANISGGLNVSAGNVLLATESGNVGIGTTAPGTTLDVRGNIAILAGSDIRPTADSTTAINIANAAGTDFVIFDTTNSRVGIGGTPVAFDDLSVISAAGQPQIGIRASTADTPTNLLFVSASGASTSSTVGIITWITGTDNIASLSAAKDGATDSAYIQFSTQPTAGVVTERMRITSGGNVSITLPTDTGTEGVCHTGNDAQTSPANLTSCSGTPAADYMEFYGTEPNVEPGDIVTTGATFIQTKDGDNIVKLVKSTTPYQQNIIGIVSDPLHAGDFNSIGYNIKEEDNPMPVALSGRVKVKVSSEGGAINPGDLLTSSSTPGTAMKAAKGGRVIGIALEPFDGKTGKVMMFVNVHENLAPKLNELAQENSQIKSQIEQLKQEIQELKKMRCCTNNKRK